MAVLIDGGKIKLLQDCASRGEDGFVIISKSHFGVSVSITDEYGDKTCWPEQVIDAYGLSFVGDVIFHKGHFFLTLPHSVNKFTREGKFLTEWGKEGREAGAFRYPTGITVLDNIFYVLDSHNHRIEMFEENGDFIEIWRGSEEVKQPRGLVLDVDGNILVQDLEVPGSNRYCLRRFNPSGDLLMTYKGYFRHEDSFVHPQILLDDKAKEIFMTENIVYMPYW